jgi:hypothetical protein
MRCSSGVSYLNFLPSSLRSQFWGFCLRLSEPLKSSPSILSGLEDGVDFGGIGGGVRMWGGDGVWLRSDNGRLEGDDGGCVDASDTVESEKSGVLGLCRLDDLLRTGRVARVDCCLRVIRLVRSWFCQLVVDEVWELILAWVERVNDEEARFGLRIRSDHQYETVVPVDHTSGR